MDAALVGAGCAMGYNPAFDFDSALNTKATSGLSGGGQDI